jgi:hypothetical protein
MKSRTFAASALLASSIWLMPFAASRADTVLYDASSFIEGQQSFTQSFNISGPGTLTVSITDINWLDVVSDLNCFLSTASGLVNPAGNGYSGASETFSGGSETFSVGSGPIYAHWFGNAQGVYNLGVIGVTITFQPAGTPVPLPASLLLLLSGLGVLFGWQRRPRAAAPASPAASAA